MEFTTGNLITLAIVLLILFLYRQMDKGNRSLEKVKRYSDKIRDDLEKFVDSKTTDIRDIAVELEVHQKSGREVLNRIKAIEDEIAGRADVLDKLNDRILGYDGSLSELEGLTQSVQENVNRIRKESEFVDTVGKKLRETQQRLGEIDKQIPDIHNKFSQENRSRFDELKEIILSESRESYQALETLVNREGERVEDLRQFVDSLEERKGAFEQRLTQSAQGLMEEALAAAEEKGSALEKRYLDELTQSTQELQSRFEEVQTGAQSRFQDLLEQYENQLASAAARGEALEGETFDRIRQQFQGDLTALEDDYKNNLSLLDSRLQDNITQVEAGLTEALESGQSRMENRLASLEENSQGAIEAFEQQLSQDIGQMKDQVVSFEREVREALSTQEDRLEDFSPRIDQMGEVVNQRIREFEESQDGALRDLVQSIQDKVTQQFQHTESVLLAKGESLSSDIIAQEESITRVVQDLEAQVQMQYQQISSQVDTHGAEANSFVVEQRDHMDSFMAQQKTRLEEFMRGQQTWMDSQGEVQEGWIVKQESRLEEWMAATQRDQQQWMEGETAQQQSRLEEVISRQDSYLKDFTEKFKASLGGLTDKLDGEKARQQEAVQGAMRDIAGQITGLEEQVASMKALSEEISLLAEDTRATALGQKDEFYQELENSRKELLSRLSDSHSSVENRVFQSLDQRLEEYEKGIAHRLDHVENLAGDIEKLDENLRNLMQSFMDKAEDNLHQFELRMEEDKNIAAERLNQDILSLGEEMKNLERDLQGLKERAYDNVSSKLKVFEDDFFTDLQNRSDAIQEKLENWSGEFDQKLTQTRQEQDSQQEALFQDMSETLTGRVEALQEQSRQQLGSLEERISAFQNTLAQQLEEGTRRIQLQDQELQQQLKVLETQSESRFDQDLKEQEALFADKLGRYEKDIQGRLGITMDAVEKGRLENQQLLDAAREDVARWQNKILQDIKTSEGEYQVKIEDWKKGLDSQILQIRDEFLAQREDLVLSSQEERIRLKKELQQMTEQMTDLQQNLKERTLSAIEGLEREKEVFLIDFQKRTREIIAESDDKQKDLYQSLQEARNSLDAHQENFSQRINENYQLISSNLEALERRQQEFVAQTKIFDRADTMKLELESRIGELKSDLARVEKDRQELISLAEEIQKIKDLTGVVSDKLSDFYDQRNKIESLEGDFQKVVAISNSIDTKLVSVTQSHDKLQDIQLKIRRLEENEQDVSQKYQRLEQKQALLDATIDGVDRGFDSLKEMEDKIGTIKEQIINLPEQVTSIQNLLDQVQTDKSQVDQAVRQLAALDDNVQAIEGRIAEMNKAREWLARTETRLEEISKQAEEQVRLLGTLAKDDSGARRAKGAPAMDIRESVVKLARQNWKVEEIARATKLSRGEVELILEMGFKS